MDKIMFKITKNYLTVSLLKKDLPKENLNNTNVIDTKEIVFSKDYIFANQDLVTSFLNVIILKRNVTKAIINDYEIIEFILKIINYIPNIKELNIKPDKTINYNIFLLLLENKYLESISVYDIPGYLLERLDVNKDLKIDVRSELFFISDFMSENNLTTYSKLYYKKHIIIDCSFDDITKEDFDTFIKINNHLKTIDIIKFNENDFIYIINSLVKYNKNSIKIIIEEKNNNIETIYNAINSLKNDYDKYFKFNLIDFKINYSIEFKKNNLVKQLNLNFIKISLISVISLILILMSINYYKNFTQKKDILNIEKEINDIIKQIDNEYTIDDNDIGYEIILPDEEVPTTTKKSTYVSSYYKNYDKVFETLLKINDDTIGWLTVNNTRIDYPVVQAEDNDYYLTRDFNKYKNSMGWVFMDYRNNIEVLNQNTIIYAHNINGGIMFGQLRNTLKESWYKKPENQIITFNTLNNNMKWQIISIYNVPNTTDYLKTSFYEKEKYEEFIALIVGRSIYDFNQTVTYEDKILTLSTCHNRGAERAVVHAKLIKE